MCKKCNKKHKYTEKHCAMLTIEVNMKRKYIIRINCQTIWVCNFGYTGFTAHFLVYAMKSLKLGSCTAANDTLSQIRLH